MMISAGHGFINQSDKYSKDNAGNSLKKYILLKENELAYNHGASKTSKYGCCYILNEHEARIPYVYHCFSLLEIVNSKYIELYLNTSIVEKQLGKLITSTARMDGLLNISYDDYMSIKISLPPKEEQEKIADFISLIDQKIEKQKKLVELLKKYKKGVTEQIFQQNKNNWNCKKIEEICKIQTGKSNTQDEVENGKFDFYVRSPIVRKSNRFLYDCEAVLTVGDGVGTGKVFHYVNGKFDLHQRVYAMTDFREVSAKYFYFYFSHFFYDRVRRMTAKTSVDSVRYDMISQMDIYIPNQIEQEKIVDLLSAFENKFLIEQLKLQNLELQKKAFLQQLFV